jgi:hypothetical protein
VGVELNRDKDAEVREEDDQPGQPDTDENRKTRLPAAEQHASTAENGEQDDRDRKRERDRQHDEIREQQLEVVRLPLIDEDADLRRAGLCVVGHPDQPTLIEGQKQDEEAAERE